MTHTNKHIIFIGDVHGKYERYKRILKQATKAGIPTIQVGDMGIGFKRFNPSYPELETYYSNPPYDHMIRGEHRFIRGNHDNPSVCKKHSQYIPDGTVEDDIMFIGGAYSIDWQYRMEGYSWWPDEELSSDELDNIFNEYIKIKPRVMVTHECPESTALYMCHRLFKLDNPSVTRTSFQKFLDAHQPEIWIYGHWHLSFDKEINGTRFICLNELETKELDI